MRSANLLHSRLGATLPTVLLIAATLIGIGAGILRISVQRHRIIYQIASWKGALLSAEAGVDIALNEVRMNLRQPANAFQSSNGWTRTTPVGISSGQAYTSTKYTMTSPVILRDGEGGQRSWAEIAVDAPSFLRSQSGEQWYRIRAKGVAEVSGRAIVAGDKLDTRLRKLDLRVDHLTQLVVSTPRSTRTVEVVVKPVKIFRFGLCGLSSITLSDQAVTFDSYDSRDIKKSSNGRYDANKTQQNADVATNGELLQAGNAVIRGDAYAHGGTVLDAAHVTGEIRGDVSQTVNLISRPTDSPDPFTPQSITAGTTINAQALTPAKYLLSALTLADNQTLRIKGSLSGSPTYCQIVVNGDVLMNGSGQISLDRGVNVRLYVTGNATLNGTGILNQGQPAQFQVYGCDRPVSPDGTVSYGKINITGTGFTGAVYAPQYDISVVGGGGSDTFFGSLVGNTVTMSGLQTFHYDEAVGDSGIVTDYRIVSWFEDER